jgi:hypothetical protein
MQAIEAEEVVLGHPDVGEGQLGGVLGVQPHLVEVAPALEPGHVALDRQQRDPLVARFRVGACHDDHQVGEDPVADEGLGAVQHVVVAGVDRGGPNALQVGPGTRLSHRDCGDQLTRHESRQPAGLLRRRPEGGDVGHDDVGVDGETGSGGTGTGRLLGQDHVVAEVRDPCPAVLLLDVEAQEPGPAGLEPDLARDHPVRLPLRVVGLHRPLEEGACRGTEVLVLLLEDGGTIRHDFSGLRGHGPSPAG